MDVTYEVDFSDSVNTAVSSLPEVGILENPDMHEVALSRMSAMTLEDPRADVMDDQVISDFWESGCSCSKWNGKDCGRQFSVSHVQEIRMQH